MELWIEEIENIAELHGMHQSVMLSAASFKLTKTSRHWLDLSTGSVNKYKIILVYKSWYSSPKLLANLKEEFSSVP